MDVVKVARELIRTRSLPGEERDVAYLIRDFLGEAGVDRVFIDGWGNVIGVVEGGVEGSIVFEGHMDHVPEGDLSRWNVDPYGGVITDDRLYGRGSVDMKGAIASMIVSASLLGDGRVLPTVYYVFVPFEEISEGTLFRLALEDSLRIRPELVVLGEATDLNMHIGHRGRSVFRVLLRGRAAHASMPWEGVNPLLAAGRLFTILEDSIGKLPVHGVLGRSSFAPTIIECSPRSTPLIPDRCTIWIDYRMVLGETEDSIKEFFEGKLELLKHEGRVLDYSIEVNSGEAVMWTGKRITYRDFYPSWLIEQNKVERLYEIVHKTNPSTEIGVWRFSTDGVYSAGIAGIATIGIGPGDEKLAHQPNEHVPIKHLQKTTQIYKTIIEKSLRPN